MIYVIDASVYVFRAWFSVSDEMVDADANPVNALYGFASFLSDFIEYERPERVAVAFDVSLGTCFRNDIYPEYKANRDPAPPELKRQFAQCRRLTEALGLKVYAEERYEADDLIGTVMRQAREAGYPVTVLSRDKDLLQLLQDGDELWDYAGNKRTAYHQVSDVFGVTAEQMADYLALAGDSVDNVPGVRGVGPKTAAALLNHFDDLDGIYANLDSVSNVDVRGARTLGAKLDTHRDMAYLSRELTRIRCDAPVDGHPDFTVREAPDLDAIGDLYDEAAFGSSLRRRAERIADAF